MLRQSGTFRSNEAVAERVMDSNDLEKERGITILAKNTAIHYQRLQNQHRRHPRPRRLRRRSRARPQDGRRRSPPGRRLAKAPSPRPATSSPRPSKPSSPPSSSSIRSTAPTPAVQEVLNEVYDLFIDLDADESVLEFPVIYTNGKLGTATMDLAVPGTDLQPLFELIFQTIPAAPGTARRRPPDPRHQSRLLRLPRPPRHLPASSTAPSSAGEEVNLSKHRRHAA